MPAGRPSAIEFAPYYLRYISLVPEVDVLSVLEAQLDELAHMIRAITPEQEQYRYAENKWSIREVVGHMTDAERIFGFRAFCISRGEQTPLPGFEQDPYVVESHYHGQPLAELLQEFTLTRRSNLAFLEKLDDGDWLRMGTASDNPVSVRALAFMMAGHVRHHCSGLQTAYGVTVGR
jgi:hypothetical protein